MSTKKHLVLDDDVHEALEERKELTGSPIKEIGNSVLRSYLESVLLGDILGNILIKKGLVSKSDYEQAIEQASAQLKKPHKLPIQRTTKGTVVAGSWESRQLFQRSDGAFQIIELWTKDSRQLPIQQHSHPGDEFLVLLKGRVILTMNGVPYTLRSLNMLQIPAGAVHSLKPCDCDCHLLSILSPAVSEWFRPSNGM
jgi:quercetin dioxygenase-like cupin family protein